MTALFRRLAVVLLTMLTASVNAGETGEGKCASLEVFVADGCPHCAEAKRFLPQYQRDHPDIEITFQNIGQSQAIRDRLQSISLAHEVSRPGVPSFYACGQLFVGFSTPQAMQSVLESMARLELPRAHTDEPVLPFFGRINLSEHGLVAFTLAVGLADGFNPCAMWVLLFLLSLLVHVKSRRRMMLIASTFVLAGGAVYFAIMAAWLNVFLLIGYVRPVQLALAMFALVVGTVHLKDAALPGRGLSFSIPERYKPGIFRRVREVVQAEHLTTALFGVAVLAVMVNLIELLCTAGLPALYTQVLTQQALSAPSYYGYLVLYNLAYIFDDGLMVAIAVISFSQLRLEVRQGRWLKLLSGALIFSLGLTLLLAPDWLF
jgi:glutaredoxin